MPIHIVIFRMPTCSGFGECLAQTDEPDVYSKHTDVSCEYGCEPLQCSNFAICGAREPKWYLNCHDGRCLHCNMLICKNLTFKELPEECPICTEVSKCVVLPNCTHTLCITCFRRCYVNGPPRVNEPQFPYPEHEDEYFSIGNNPDNPMYHDPLVMKFNEDWNKYDDEWNLQYANENNLRKCPICRS
jgi:hypothetical protein